MENFKQLPDKIREEELALLSLIDEVENLKDINSKIENETLYLITQKLNPEGKPLFSNDMQRKVELARQLKERGDYTYQEELLKKKVRTKKEAEINLEFLKRYFEVLKTLGGGLNG